MARILMDWFKGVMVLLTLYFIGCINRNESVLEKVDRVSIPNLVQLAYENRGNKKFLKLCDYLNDSIKDLNRDISLTSIASIDERFNSITWGIVWNDQLSTSYNDKYILKTKIIKGNVIVEDQSINDKSDLTQIAQGFISNSTSYKKTILVDDYGEVDVPIAGFELLIRPEQESLSYKEWELFFGYLHLIFSFIDEERNKHANEIWSQSYENLDFTQKKIITEIVYYRVLININLKGNSRQNF